MEYEDDDGTDNHDVVIDGSDGDIEDPSRMILCCRYKSMHAFDLPRLAMDFKNILSSNAVGGPDRNKGKRLLSSLLVFPVSVVVVVLFPIIIFHTDFNLAALDFVCDKALIASPKIRGVRIG